MIKVGIAGADTQTAGEILRLCLHHPDVEIITAYAPELAGRPVTSLHYGFIGEERILFTSNFDATSLDVAILLRPMYSQSDWAKLMADRPGLKLILFPGTEGAAESLSQNPVYGLSEMNRKPLVRGARVAVVPTPMAALALIALYPIAAHLMLPPRLRLEYEAPEDIIADESFRAATAAEIAGNLQSVQSSFPGQIEISAKPCPNVRGMKLRMDLPLGVSVDEMMKIYDSIYDDHNFTHLVTHSVEMAEVEGTHRVVISVMKNPEGGLTVQAVADPRMRGGAGEAVHLMNLLFSLHEKTGLDLKTTGWTKPNV